MEAMTNVAGEGSHSFRSWMVRSKVSHDHEGGSSATRRLTMPARISFEVCGV